MGTGTGRRAAAQALEASAAPVETLRNEIRALGGRLGQLGQYKALLAQLEGSRPALTLLGLISQSARQCGGRLRLEELTARTAQDETAGSPATLTLKGAAADNLAVARFVAGLRQTAAFQRVELKGSEQKNVEGGQSHSFVIECTY